ncbi:MAG: cation diffusion facilitator family transporter [Bacteroidota bacterium]|nr:cation diffusion facilitator family transporter [Bacteroidota bacterium]
MEHNHSHHDHSHSIVLTNVNSAFIIGIILNFLFVIIEAVIGFSINSLSLLSDAGHNLADVGSLGLSLLAFRLLKVKPNNQYTYGYRKTTILAALFNAMILLLSIGAIVYEAINRFIKPTPLPGKTIAIVAFIGIIINFGTARLFMKNKEKDLNIRSAYLHMMSDALVSAGLVIGGIIIFYTKWYLLDPIFSIVIAIIILAGTWSLLRESLRLSLDGVPKDIDLDEIRNKTSMIEGVKNIHHIHVWAMSTTENAMTGHAVFESKMNYEEISEIKNKIKHELQHFNIQHTTLETEFEENPCKKPEC